jgi:NAD(P)H-hydrate epimerase
LWAAALPRPGAGDHKYSRGHVLAAGGASMIGAGCLTVRAAQRAGAGMVTCAVPVQQAPLYRLALESAVVRSAKDTRAFRDILEARPVDCAVIGPGLGVFAPGAHEKVLSILRSGAPAVLDADALSLFEEMPQTLFDQIAGPVLLTPHEGEFRRLFPDLAADTGTGKLHRAREAAARSGAVVLLKGADTVIAAPDGTAVLNTDAPPDLATAGAGDVLSGTAAGLIAGGMPIFAAACAAAFATGAAARRAGPGLIASDLPGHLPSVLNGFRQIASN